ncbi:hypothetical protein [Salinibacterium sp.]|uniref:hypothetical protein n=1 Tax=Salinibacterium sp. TaxID=1915057 RepID=UPI00286A8913|nr:hypothetical protein [Salinibacterium sp.]
MLRSDYEGNEIWSVLDEVRARLGTIRGEGNPVDIAVGTTIGFYADHIGTFRENSGTSSPLFVTAMLTPVRDTLASVLQYLDQRLAYGGQDPAYLESARVTIEAALVQMAPWPRPYARGGQVQQLTTLYEDLLERQRIDLAALNESHATLRVEIEQYRGQVASIANSSQTDVDNLAGLAGEALATVNAEKARIDEVITAGVKQLSEMSLQLDKRQKEWQAAQEARFDETLAPYLSSISESKNLATQSLSALQEVESDFANLTAASVTDKLAGHFADEAKAGRRAGTYLYIIGAVFILAAALPLLLLLLPNGLSSDAGTRWEQLAIRTGIGAAAASAATVAIRLGGRFFTSANVAKRMELDLKTFGPFLANVDPTEVGKARISLVERALGNSTPDGKDSGEAVSVNGVSQILDSASKLIPRA